MPLVFLFRFVSLALGPGDLDALAADFANHRALYFESYATLGATGEALFSSVPQRIGNNMRKASAWGGGVRGWQ